MNKKKTKVKPWQAIIWLDADISILSRRLPREYTGQNYLWKDGFLRTVFPNVTSPPPCMEAGGEGGVVLYALSSRLSWRIGFAFRLRLYRSPAAS